jgi:hypothetical protein
MPLDELKLQFALPGDALDRANGNVELGCDLTHAGATRSSQSGTNTLLQLRGYPRATARRADNFLAAMGAKHPIISATLAGHFSSPVI